MPRNGLIDANADDMQHCAMDKNAHHHAATPINVLTHVQPVLSMNWRCTICAMHFAYGRLTIAPEKCERCGSKGLDPY